MAALLTALTTALLLVGAVAQRSVRELRLWALGNVLVFIGYAITSATMLPLWAQGVLGYGVYMLGLLQVWRGTSLFVRRAWRWQSGALVLGTLLAGCLYFAYANPWLEGRQMCSLLLSAGVLGQCAWLLLKQEQKSPGQMLWIAGGGYAVMSVVLLAEVIIRLEFAWGEGWAVGYWFDISPGLLTALVMPVTQVVVAYGMLLMLLNRQLVRLSNQVHIDMLTGMPNRAGLLAFADRLLPRAVLEQLPVAVLVIDVDHFKKVNDTYGHLAGDDVLEAVGARLRQTLRPGDCLCRFGGEEFVAMLPGMTPYAALEVAQRLCSNMASLPVTVEGKPLRITVSVGCANSQHYGYDLDALIAAADSAMYEAKNSGRNRALSASLQ
ncbi:GGDEF domain-containing protein [Curvibacter sp. CHRR-16]|uniref:GGDEF domain-containing protein n=1 Tax=Curvibacter sp. CHRR-16 TaxID=2835872 RepID=UPI001BDA7414|nr:GGDEF domain-containing protein [Curvibacter sp. CHRR-16]MBT0570392.1 GGDEF domain-containing protein [Curvibacter sp. CHRR-16]